MLGYRRCDPRRSQAVYSHDGGWNGPAAHLFGRRRPRLGQFCFGQFHAAKRGERLTNNLVHIVILIRAKPADEDNVVLISRQRLVALVKRLVFRPRNRIIWFTLTMGELVGNAGFRNVPDPSGACIR